MFRKQILLAITILFFLGYMLPQWAAISFVYNLRIAETSKRTVSEMDDPHLYSELITTVPFQYRKKYDGTRQTIIGGLASLIYTPPRYFLRVDTAGARVRSKSCTSCSEVTEPDDLLFSGGYSPKISKRTKITFSGLFGVPLHKDHSLETIQFGYAHFSLGAQFDSGVIYHVSDSKTKFSIRSAARFIHFFPRRVAVPLSGVISHFKFNIGHLMDLFIAHHTNFGKSRFEFGYNPSFFFGATIKPHFDDAVAKSNYIRSSVYASYKYKFNMRRHAGKFATNISYGLDHRPKKFGNKTIVTVWASFEVDF